MIKPLPQSVQDLKVISEQLSVHMESLYAISDISVEADGSIVIDGSLAGSLEPSSSAFTAVTALVAMRQWMTLNVGVLQSALRDTARIDAVFHPDMDPLDFNLPEAIKPVESARLHGGRQTMDVAIDYVLGAKGDEPAMASWKA